MQSDGATSNIYKNNKIKWLEIHMTPDYKKIEILKQKAEIESPF